jgi:hypothetical protein
LKEKSQFQEPSKNLPRTFQEPSKIVLGGNGMEQGMEEEQGKGKVKGKSFIPPTWEELRAYMVELADESGKPKSPMPQYYRYKPEELSFFFSYYQGNGWTTKDGKTISSWKGKLLTWIKIWLDKNPPQIVEGV